MAQYNRRLTALVIVQNVCAILGLPVPQIVVGNTTDATAAQMLALLNDEGRRMLTPTEGNRWQVLSRTWELTTVPGQTVYPMPDDWDSFIDSTAWNQSSRLPMIGPALDSQWAMLAARNLGPTTISLVYRTRGDQFELYFSPSEAQNLRIDYSSRSWVQTSGGGAYKDTLELDSDVVLFDATLMTAALKLRFLTEKGFDTTAALADFNSLLEKAMNADSDAPVLNTSPSLGFPLISTALNVPDSGYGG